MLVNDFHSGSCDFASTFNTNTSAKAKYAAMNNTERHTARMFMANLPERQGNARILRAFCQRSGAHFRMPHRSNHVQETVVGFAKGNIEFLMSPLLRYKQESLRER